MDRIASLIIAVLLVIAPSLGYAYHQEERELEKRENEGAGDAQAEKLFNLTQSLSD